MQDNSHAALKRPFADLLSKTLKTLSDVLTRVTIFQQEHRLFKDEFKLVSRAVCWQHFDQLYEFQLFSTNIEVLLYCFCLLCQFLFSEFTFFSTKTYQEFKIHLLLFGKIQWELQLLLQEKLLQSDHLESNIDGSTCIFHSVLLTTVFATTKQNYNFLPFFPVFGLWN